MIKPQLKSNKDIPEVLPDEKTAVFKKIAKQFGTPLYVYFENEIKNNFQKFADIPVPFGLIVRYAVKANSTGAVVRLLDKMGVYFDASTFNECVRLIEGAGIDGKKIRLTSQEVQSTENLMYLAKKKVLYTACSLSQLDVYGKNFPNSEITIRFNIGIGSGHFPQVATGGINSSFGIYKQRKEIDLLLKKHKLLLKGVHLHIGSGSDPEKQKEAMLEGLKIVREYPEVNTLSMGGGFKVGIMNYDKSTDIFAMGEMMKHILINFEKVTGRKIKLEVEPGKALVQTAGYILTEIIDKVKTVNGKEFLKVNGGMNMNARIPMHGAAHPFVVISKNNKSKSYKNYIVNGICCESSDILTIRTWEPTIIESRKMYKADIGDFFVIGGAGSYCSSMAPLNYNSQQIHPEILVRKNGDLNLIRERQPLEDLWRYEKIPDDLK